MCEHKIIDCVKPGGWGNIQSADISILTEDLRIYPQSGQNSCTKNLFPQKRR